jgi:hypothetical protein
MLMRMYLMWEKSHGYKIKELNFQEGDVAGIKTVTLEFEGDFAFGYLKGENGYIVWFEFLHLTVMPNVIPHLLQYMFIHWLMIVSKLKLILLILKLQLRVLVVQVDKM